MGRSAKITAAEMGVSIGTVVKIDRAGRGYSALTPKGEDIASKIATYALKNAFRANKALELSETKTGGTNWRQVSLSDWSLAEGAARVVEGADLTSMINIAAVLPPDGDFGNHADFVSFLQKCISLKPKKLKIDELWWKFAVRAALRGNSLLVVGPSGCGKTLLANALKVALNRVDKYFYVNLGATQDPRSTLIGNTHYDPTMGTYVSLSYFAHAIQVPNAIILLDEASRAHPEAHNILMTVLDKSQRYMRVDEKADTQTIKVAEGVCFVLTANVGAEYTATRTMDRALLDRCTMFEMRPLSEGDEFDNLTSMFPDVKASMLKAIAKIADVTRKEINSESPKVDTIISTRMTEEMASLIHDGFNLAGAAETCIYPYFNDAGGADSPRSFMKALVQKHLPTEFDDKATPFKDADPNKNKATPWG